jgi:hypothetical protein
VTVSLKNCFGWILCLTKSYFSMSEFMFCIMNFMAMFYNFHKGKIPNPNIFNVEVYCIQNTTFSIWVTDFIFYPCLHKVATDFTNEVCSISVWYSSNLLHIIILYILREPPLLVHAVISDVILQVYGLDTWCKHLHNIMRKS